MKTQTIDFLVYQLNFGGAKDQQRAFQKIKRLALQAGIFPASINALYLARGRGEASLDFTVPAMNLRGIAYDMARAAFKAANQGRVGALIFELARSEMNYTNQSPQQYSGTVMAAGLKEGFHGPLFIQGDHFQVKCSQQPGVPQPGEIEAVKKLIKESAASAFYNLDLDISTLVDYSPKEIREQQRQNFQIAAQLTAYVRQIEPQGITISLGGEIGHIGGKNSTEEELRAYMDGYNQSLGKGQAGLSKMAIQTGTHHGGVPLPDGSLAEVAVDFSCLKRLAQVSREYGLGGTVQHGASTLPDEFFRQFVQAEAVEVHLATGFQNIIMEHPKFPQALLKRIYRWLDTQLAGEKKEGQTSEQFHYKLRKKAWGQFKRETWQLAEKIRGPIREALTERFAFLFRELGVENSRAMILEVIGDSANE